MHLIRVILVAALVSFAGSAAAQVAPMVAQDNYLHLRLGAVLPQSSDLKDFELKTGFDGEVAFGHRFSPNLAGELGIGYFSAEGSTFSVFDPGSGLNIDLKGKFSGIPITASVKAIAPVSSQMDLYGLLGLGLYKVTLETTGSALGVSVSTSDDDTAFGLLLGAGMSFDVTPTVFLSADLRYVIAKATFFEAEGNIDSLFISAGLGTRF